MKTPKPQSAGLSPRDRARRILIMCERFARNLAYVRAARDEGLQPYDDPEVQFLITSASNALDICVLEWCKMFGDRNAKFHWRRVAPEPNQFQGAMLKHLELNQTDYDGYVEQIRHYRDKFVAHLDHEDWMSIPQFDIAFKAVQYYHAFVWDHFPPEALKGLCRDLESGYLVCVNEGRRAVSTICSGARKRRQ